MKVEVMLKNNLLSIIEEVLSATTFPAIANANQGNKGNHPSNKNLFQILISFKKRCKTILGFSVISISVISNL
jgi:hypothetical protein